MQRKNKLGAFLGKSWMYPVLLWMLTCTGPARDFFDEVITVKAPQFSPASGVYNTDQNVAISTTTADAVICYTDDGSTPQCNAAKDGCEAGTKYTSAIAVAGDGTSKSFKAMACKSGMDDSTVATATITIEYTPPQQTTFAQSMKTSVIPTLTAKAWNGSDWVVIPTTHAIIVWADSTTLNWNSGWVRYPETTRLQFTLSGLQDAGGNAVADVVKEITTTARNSRGSGAIADTGQTSCFYCDGYNSDEDCSDSGEAWTEDASCLQSYAVGSFDKPQGQDAHYPDKPTARSFTGPTPHATYTSDYTTTDNVTGLVWKSCVEGQSGSSCTGSATQHPWYNAVNQCAALNTANGGAGYAGRTNWRLPTVSELETLPNSGASNPAIDATPFPATPTTQYTWSSTTYIASPGNAWSVYFNYGYVYHNSKTTNYYVRCVSSGPSGASSFTNNGNGTVTDSATGLVWQQCGKGRNVDSTCSDNGIVTDDSATWLAALEYCDNLNLASHTDWRLPSANELKTIVDRSTSAAPYIDTTYFPSTPSNFYWSSTTYIASPGNAWNVFFNFGFVDASLKTFNSYVRCVRSAP